jgi:myo-inositol-1(or 4)-monophosphatase
MVDRRLDRGEAFMTRSIVDVAIDAAREAGALLRDHFGGARRIEAKPDGSLVTDLDREAEKIIIDKIHSDFPGHGILAEESGAALGGSDTVWVIDPLDGTHNYIHGLRIYGVSIGVVRNGRFVAGVIYRPADNQLFAAEEGSGTLRNGEPVRVSVADEIDKSSLSFDSGLRNDPQERFAVLQRLARRAFNVRMLGSSAYILSSVAEGTVDIAVEFDDRPWDFAAGVCLIREAGGSLHGMHGEEMNLEMSSYIAANAVLEVKVRELMLNKELF